MNAARERRPAAEDGGIGRERNALIAALCAVLLWSTVATGFKLGLRHLGVVQLLFTGSVISWLVFALAAKLTAAPRVRPNERGLVVVLALLNPVGYYLILFSAYARLPAQIAQPLNYTWAIVLALLAVPILKQRLSSRTLTGIVISYAGVVVIVSRNPIDQSLPLDPLGVMLALVSTVLWAGYWLLNTRSRSAPLSLMSASFGIAVPLLGVACWLGPGWPPLSLHTLIYGAWVGLVEMGVTFLLWQRALRLTTSAARIGQLIFIAPFASMILISEVLDEPIAGRSVLGLVCVVVGLVVTRTPDFRAAEPR